MDMNENSNEEKIKQLTTDINKLRENYEWLSAMFTAGRDAWMLTNEDHDKYLKMGPESIPLILQNKIKDLKIIIENKNKIMEALANAIPDAKKLLILADLLDVLYPMDPNPEAQTDIRKWAENGEEALKLYKGQTQ